MKAIFYFVLGALSILFISQTNKDNQPTKSIENGVSTQQLIKANGEGKTPKTPKTPKAVSKLSNKTVENYLLKYLSNYTINTTSTKQISTTAKTKSNSTSTSHYSKSAKPNTYPTSKTNFTNQKPPKNYYSYAKPKSSNSSYKPTKYKKAQPTEPITYYSNSYNETVQSPTRYTGKPLGATAICRDGTYSFSRNRRGTCSRHGGVKSWL